MGRKYMIAAFGYPYKGCWEHIKQTDFFLAALFWLIVYSIKYFGVDFVKRG